jgi:hypothetical protein
VAEATARAEKQITTIDNSDNPVPPRTGDTYPTFQRLFVFLRELWGCHAVSVLLDKIGYSDEWFHKDFRPWSTRSDKK